MLIVICGQKASGKSVALEILQQSNYEIFNTDKWIHEIYQYNEIGFNAIRDKLGCQFVNSKAVDREKLNLWIKSAAIPGSSINQNLIKLNNITIPIIKRKLVELKNSLDTNKILFVELAIYLNHYEIFKDICDDVIFISRKINQPKKQGEAYSYLEESIQKNWYVVENNESITEYKKNLIATVDRIIKNNYKKRSHITEITGKIC